MPRPCPGVGAIILMAGKGTRFKSETAKVLHPVLGHPMGAWVIEALRNAGITTRVLVVGHQAEAVQATFPDHITALQSPQNGTGHAVKVGLKKLPKDCTTVLVVNGDSPLLIPETIAALLKRHTQRKASCTLAVTSPSDPTGLGRVFLDAKDNVLDMIEHKDCTAEQRLCDTVNTGLYAFERKSLEKYLKKLGTNNAQGEEYLTDVPKMLAEAGATVAAIHDEVSFTLMPNNRAELAMAAAILQYRIVDELYAAGVSIPQPDDVYIEPQVRIGKDTTIWGGTYLRGGTSIGAHCTIGPGADCTNATIKDEVTLRYSVIADSEIGTGATVGPYAHLRGGAKIGKNTRIGNFVELKKSTFADGAKASHLSYVGDATVGEKSNIGAGTITCNYDGVNKHPTTIGSNVFIGSDSILVAPVTIGDGAMTAAGSVITEDVPTNNLAFGRARQSNKPPRVLDAIKAAQRGHGGKS